MRLPQRRVRTFLSPPAPARSPLFDPVEAVMARDPSPRPRSRSGGARAQEELPAVTGAIATADFRPDRMREVMDAQLLATDIADYLVRRGVPFRSSHEVVGRLVRMAEERGVALSDLTLEDFRSADDTFEADVHDVFDWRASADARDAAGGTSNRSVLVQLAEAATRIGEARATLG